MTSHFAVELPPFPRGYHLVTSLITRNIPMAGDGVIHCFIQHTSAGLTVNENADPDVREDFETIMNRLVPEEQEGLLHTLEGPDDMPAHIKASLVGSSVSIPFNEGELLLGTWQGIYLCEFRDHAPGRRVIVSVTQ